MKITYDPEVDVLYVGIRHVKTVDSIDVESGVSVDLDAEGHIIGIEILDAKSRVGRDPLSAISIERLGTEDREDDAHSDVA